MLFVQRNGKWFPSEDLVYNDPVNQDILNNCMKNGSLDDPYVRFNLTKLKEMEEWTENWRERTRKFEKTNKIMMTLAIVTFSLLIISLILNIVKDLSGK